MSRQHSMFVIILGSLVVTSLIILLDFRGITTSISLFLRSFSFLLIEAVGLFGMGAFFIEYLGFKNRQDGFYYLFSIALGMAILSYMMFFFGMLGLYYPLFAWLIFFGFASIGILKIIKNRRDYQNALQVKKLPRKIPIFITIILLLIVLNIIYPLFTEVFIPPLHFDEIAYHLPVPQIYIQHHKITYIPFIPYSNWPMGVEMMFVFQLLMGQEIQVHMLMWGTFLLIIGGLFLISDQLFGKYSGVYAVAIFSGTPLVTTLAGTGLIELPLTMYLFFAITCSLIWFLNQELRYLLLSAIFAGFAASIKLNAAVTVALIGVFILIHTFARRGFKPAVLDFLIFGGLSGIIVSPWYMKSWILTGNPFWPFLPEIFGSYNWDSLGQEYLLGFIRLPNLAFTFGNWLQGIWLLTTQTEKFGSYRFELGWHYLIFIPTAIVAIFRLNTEKRRWLIDLLIIIIGLYTIWFFTTHQTRFLMPVMPLMALLAGIGINHFLTFRVGRVWKLALQGTLLLFFITTHWVLDANDRITFRNRWDFIRGKMSRETFLEKNLSGYPVFEYIATELPRNAYILMGLYESRGYYLERDYFWVNPIAQRVFRLEEYEDVEKLKTDLLENGFTHILFNENLVNQFLYISHGPSITQLFQSLLDETTLLTESDGVKLYELHP